MILKNHPGHIRQHCKACLLSKQMDKNQMEGLHLYCASNRPYKYIRSVEAEGPVSHVDLPLGLAEH